MVCGRREPARAKPPFNLECAGVGVIREYKFNYNQKCRRRRLLFDFDWATTIYSVTGNSSPLLFYSHSILVE